MPIQGRNPEEVFNTFQGHIAKLFRETLPPPPHIRVRWTSKRGASIAILEFVRGDGITSCLPMDTDYGPLFLTIRQYLEAEKTDKHYELRTRGYSYRLINDDHPTMEAKIRWEYTGDTAAAHAYCRHHVQIATGVELIEPVLFDLDRSHTPTGWVTIEELIRFLIFELHAKHPNHNWPDALAESERAFYEDFTSRRYRWQRLRGLTGRK